MSPTDPQRAAWLAAATSLSDALSGSSEPSEPARRLAASLLQRSDLPAPMLAALRLIALDRQPAPREVLEPLVRDLRSSEIPH